jgi:hypothetical protein
MQKNCYRFCDENLLLKTLKEYGDFNVEKREGKMSAFGYIDMEFSKPHKMSLTGSKYIPNAITKTL